jgi:aerobic carbon-monoxide dehydrogenase medium subunit
MKPQPFDYADPESLEEVLGLLAAVGDDAVIIAGGQSLIPLLNLRLARPELVIDPRRVVELSTFDLGTDGLRAGAMVCAVDLEEHADVDRVPGLAAALRQIGHPQIRSRTTVGGSVAHADPAAELPALLVALGGQVVLQSTARGERTLGAEEFFLGPLMTAREPDELVTSVWIPAHRGAVTVLEVAKRPGDFAMVGAVVGYGIENDVVADPRVALFGVAGTPLRARAAEVTLAGSIPGPESFRQAGDEVRSEINPTSDSHASGDYRRDVAGTLVERALVSLL